MSNNPGSSTSGNDKEPLPSFEQAFRKSGLVPNQPFPVETVPEVVEVVKKFPEVQPPSSTLPFLPPETLQRYSKPNKSGSRNMTEANKKFQKARKDNELDGMSPQTLRRLNTLSKIIEKAEKKAENAKREKRQLLEKWKSSQGPAEQN